MIRVFNPLVDFEINLSNKKLSNDVIVDITYM